MIHLDPEQVRAARKGDRAALASVVQSLQLPVYGLAMRMLAHPADAEDAAQEILIKIITNLGTIRKVWRPEQEITEIDAHDQRVTSVLWCIGFRPSDS